MLHVQRGVAGSYPRGRIPLTRCTCALFVTVAHPPNWVRTTCDRRPSPSLRSKRRPVLRKNSYVFTASWIGDCARGSEDGSGQFIPVELSRRFDLDPQPGAVGHREIRLARDSFGGHR